MKEINLSTLKGGADITRPQLSLKYMATVIILLAAFLLAKPVADYISAKIQNMAAPVTGKVSEIID